MNSPIFKLNTLKGKTILGLIAMFVILLIASIYILYDKGYFNDELITDDNSSSTSISSSTTESSTISTSTVKPIPKVPHPLTGEMIEQTEYDRIAGLTIVPIIIENHMEARPQSGLGEAEVVYEALAEGGITRYLAVFLSQDPERIGPERSLRTYFAALGSEYEGVVLHHGYNSKRLTGSYAFDPNLIDVPNFTSKYGIKRSECGGYRDPVLVNKVAYEHTLFNNLTDIRDCIDNVDWTSSFVEYKFTDTFVASSKSSSSTVSNSKNTSSIQSSTKNSTVTSSVSSSVSSVDEFAANSVSIEFVEYTPDFKVNWTYDKVSNKYLRELAGEIDIDFNTQKQIAVKNLIIQKVPMVYSGNSEENAVFYDLVGSGDAIYIHDGIKEEVTWKKDSWTDRTIFYDGVSGKEIKFQIGNFWYEMVPLDNVGKVLGAVVIN